MVFDEPPAPAARVEFGFETVLPVARRLTRWGVQRPSSFHDAHDDIPDGCARWFSDSGSRSGATGERRFWNV